MAGEIDDEDEYALPPGPLCAKCFHHPCPCCPLPFCDLLQPECCESQCDISIEDFEMWKIECKGKGPPEGPNGEDAGWCVVSVGPWLPVSVRVERGIR